MYIDLDTFSVACIFFIKFVIFAINLCYFFIGCLFVFAFVFIYIYLYYIMYLLFQYLKLYTFMIYDNDYIL